MTETTAGVRDRELSYLTAAELTRHFRARELSPVEVTPATLRRIERLEPSLNAFIVVDAKLLGVGLKAWR
jgi:aspartyl-tRNA(Asn)/glutamyl-tRNA(Gln) amidotransferase subunit A